MRATVLSDVGVLGLGRPSRVGDPLHRICRLFDKSCRLGSPRLFGAVGSARSCANRQTAQSHICNGYTGCGPAPRPAGSSPPPVGRPVEDYLPLMAAAPSASVLGHGTVLLRFSAAAAFSSGDPALCRLPLCRDGSSYNVDRRSHCLCADPASRRPGPLHPHVRRQHRGRPRCGRCNVRSGLRVRFRYAAFAGCTAGRGRVSPSSCAVPEARSTT